MPEPLIALLKKWHSVPVATTGPDGIPNIAAKSVRVIDPHTLIWGELYFMQTYQNLQNHPVASLCVWQWTPPYTAFKVIGHVVIHEKGKMKEELDKHVWAGHGDEFLMRIKRMAAMVFTVDAIYDQTPRSDSAGKQIT